MHPSPPTGSRSRPRSRPAQRSPRAGRCRFSGSSGGSSSAPTSIRTRRASTRGRRQASGSREGARGVHATRVPPASHNSLIVEMKDYLIVFDAPVSDGHANWILNAARTKYPNKPVKYLVLTHHHMDHACGPRACAAQGATIVVGQGNGEHFRRVLAAPFKRNPDLSSRDLSATPIAEVGDKRIFSD